MLGLLSNHLLGRHAFNNEHLGIVRTVTIEDGVTLAKAGDRATISLKAQPRTNIEPGMSIYFASDPSGVGMEVPTHERFTGDPTSTEDVRLGNFPPALVIRELGADNAITLVNVSGIPVRRPPAENDYVFTQPTRRYLPAFTAWAVVPNLQVFWLVDAVTQGHKVPGRYLGLIGAYGAAQIAAFLALAVVLFQRRDVG